MGWERMGRGEDEMVPLRVVLVVMMVVAAAAVTSGDGGGGSRACHVQWACACAYAGAEQVLALVMFGACATVSPKKWLMFPSQENQVRYSVSCDIM